MEAGVEGVAVVVTVFFLILFILLLLLRFSSSEAVLFKVSSNATWTFVFRSCTFIFAFMSFLSAIPALLGRELRLEQLPLVV